MSDQPPQTIMGQAQEVASKLAAIVQDSLILDDTSDIQGQTGTSTQKSDFKQADEVREYEVPADSVSTFKACRSFTSMRRLVLMRMGLAPSSHPSPPYSLRTSP